MAQRSRVRARRSRARWLALAWLPLDVAQPLQPGGRMWVIPVTNDAALPAVPSVAEDTSGALPQHIQVARDGSPSVSAPGEPGWFGN